MGNDNIPILELINVSAGTHGKETLKDCSLNVFKAEQWALLGDSDSGKNTLLQLLYGKATIRKGEINFNFARSYLAATPTGTLRTATDLIALLSFKHQFKNKANVQQFYYQQRYNSFDVEDSRSVSDYLKSIKTVSENPYWTIPKVLDLFKLDRLSHKPCITLSNGESRRLMLAATLLKNPVLLLLDHPMVGLDVETRRNFNAIMDRITGSGIQVMMATTPDEVPTAINRIAIFKEGQLEKKGNRTLIRSQHEVPSHFPPPNLNQQIKELLATHEIPVFKTIVGMRDVHVNYGDKMILENINWEIKQGERWVLSGHNGAGKSTLLSLITADNPQAYSNSIVLFDRKRGSGESIWQIKKEIGFVSPELHQYFATSQSCLQVVCSGFFDTIGLFRTCLPEQTTLAKQWMEALHVSHLAQVKFNRISIKEQRLCLLARALVKCPTLLILDEPCQGLDKADKEYIKELIDEICKIEKTTLIYVSHYQDDIPSCVNMHLQLEGGRIKKQPNYE